MHPAVAQTPSPQRAISRRPRDTVADTDQIIVRHAATWAAYTAMRAELDSPGLRLAFNQGTLEIMSPSKRHEALKTLIGRLLETFSLVRRVPMQGFGSMTMRSELHERGLEPDECYLIGGGEPDRPPDLAVEVVLSSHGIDKLPIYATLGVGEVWFWRDGAFSVFVLDGNSYRQAEQQSAVPGLDLAVLGQFAAWDDQYAAAQAYRDALEGR